MSKKRTPAILSGHRVRMDERRLLLADHPHIPPEVVVRRNGDCIQQVEIRCHCGEVIILDCEYSAKPNAES